MSHMPPAPPRNWSGLVFGLALAALVVASFATLPLQWSALFTADAVHSVAEFLRGFVPPETGSGLCTTNSCSPCTILTQSMPVSSSRAHMPGWATTTGKVGSTFRLLS